MFIWDSNSMIVFFLLSLSTLTSGLVFNSTALIIATASDDAIRASYILTGYGIGYEASLVPKVDTPLPTLESSDGGNYGLFVVYAKTVVNGTSMLTNDQWEALWSYQRKYSVRMVHLNAIPDSGFGAQTISSGGCCDDNVEQNIALIEDVAASEFPNAGLKFVPRSIIVFTSINHTS
jgi:hypothetical protein